MEPNITYLCYLLETHQALESHAMKHYLAPQTESHLDTFPLDAPDALETPDASCVSISHIVLLHWDIPVNPGYIWSRSDPENQPLPVHRLYGISSLCQDTSICWFHQRKTNDHDRTHSQLAASCPYLCSFKGVVDADNTHLYLMYSLRYTDRRSSVH